MAAHRDKGGFYSPRVRLCSSQVACDGAYLLAGREICGRCKTALDRRNNAKPKPPRGEGYVTYTETRPRNR